MPQLEKLNERLRRLQGHLGSNQAGASTTDEGEFDVLIIGAGFGGMYALKKFRDDLGLKCRVVEQGDGVGGTWYWNCCE